MEQLLRTKVGRFVLADAKKLSEIEALRDQGTITAHLIPVPDLFPDAPRVCVKEEAVHLVYNGNPVKKSALAAPVPEGQTEILLYDHKEQFIGIFQWNEEKHRYFPEKMFYTKGNETK